MSAGSAERLLAVLSVFSEDRLEWTPEELAETLGYSRPTLYRYLKALREAGLLTSQPGAGFTLGPRVVELDHLMRRSDALIRAGQPQLQALTARHPCSALLVRWYRSKLLCVASDCSTPNPLTSYPRGRPMPMARGAISRAILAHLPRAQARPIIDANRAELAAIGLGDSPADIAAALRRIRRQGVATAHGEVTPGVVGIAAPVFDAARAPVAALCLTIAEGEVGPARPLATLAREIRAAATQLSADLAGRRLDDTGLRRSA